MYIRKDWRFWIACQLAHRAHCGYWVCLAADFGIKQQCAPIWYLLQTLVFELIPWEWACAKTVYQIRDDERSWRTMCVFVKYCFKLGKHFVETFQFLHEVHGEGLLRWTESSNTAYGLSILKRIDHWLMKIQVWVTFHINRWWSCWGSLCK